MTYAAKTAYHISTLLYFPIPADKTAQTLAALQLDIQFFTMVLHLSQLYHAHADSYVNLQSQMHDRMLRIYGHSTHLQAALQYDIPWN